MKNPPTSCSLAFDTFTKSNCMWMYRRGLSLQATPLSKCAIYLIHSTLSSVPYGHTTISISPSSAHSHRPLLSLLVFTQPPFLTFQFQFQFQFQFHSSMHRVEQNFTVENPTSKHPADHKSSVPHPSCTRLTASFLLVFLLFRSQAGSILIPNLTSMHR